MTGPARTMLTAKAAAKVNLTLAVLGRRADGYHELESLVVFAAHGDRLTFTPGPHLDLAVTGRTAQDAGELADNLVLKAARAFADRHHACTVGRFELVKELPVAAGLGGGSADAAAALRLLAEVNGLSRSDERLVAIARATGADVPVCLDPQPRLMRGIGDVLSPPLPLPALPAVLVNPGVAVPTRDVFAALKLEPVENRRKSSAAATDIPQTLSGLVSVLRSSANDLEAPAIAIAPVIAEALDRLRGSSDCLLARMSGSGATCFGLFGSNAAAAHAAEAIKKAKPGWWVCPTVLGSGGS